MKKTIEAILINKYKQYANIRHAIPYVYSMSSQGHTILYCGTSHYLSYADSGIQYIIKLFRWYNPDLMIVEGIPWLNESKLIRKLGQYNEKELIDKFGENILFAVLAGKDGKVVISPEPSLKKEMNYVCNYGYTIWEFLLFYMFKLGIQWLQQKNRESIEGYIKKCDTYLYQELNEFYTDYRNCFQAKMRILLEHANANQLKTVIDPVLRKYQNHYFDGKYNQISRLSNICRDIDIINTIIRNSQKFNRIMVVYGATHAYVQQVVIKAYFYNNFGFK